MKFLGKLSFFLCILILVLGLIALFLLPALKVRLMAQETALTLVMIGEALSFLISIIALKNRWGRYAALISLLIVVAIVLNFAFAGDNPLTWVKQTVQKLINRIF